MSSLRLDISQGATPPYLPANIRGYGHSIAFGGAATRVGTTNFYPRLFHDLGTTDYTCSYLGHPSQSTRDMLPQAAADVDAYVVADKINIFMYMEVINSVSYYMAGPPGLGKVAAAAAAIADHLTMFAARKAAGYQIGIAYTMYHPFGFNADQNDCVDLINQGLRDAVGHGIGINAVIDVGVDPRFAITGPPGVSVVVSDNTHPTDYGHQIISDLSLPVVRSLFHATGAPLPTWVPNDLGQLVWWYEADPSFVVFNLSNKVTQWTDRTSWLFHLTASGANSPTWNASNATWSGKPSIDAAANWMTTALNVDMSYTKTFEMVLVYQCTNTGPIVAEFSNSSSSFADTWIIQYANILTGHHLVTFGNVGNSFARTTGPTTPRAVSFCVQNVSPTNQVSVLDEGTTAAGLVQGNAPNTNLFGLRPLNLFARSGNVAPATMTTVFCACFSRVLTGPERTQLLAYIQGKWPH